MLYLAQPAIVTNVIHGYSGEIEFVKSAGFIRQKQTYQIYKKNRLICFCKAVNE